MHLCYLDDSGDSRNGVTITALLIEERQWSAVLNAWLDGRRAIHREFGVLKRSEIHANDLYKGRGRTASVSKPDAYARTIAWLEDWASEQDTYLLVFYDGQQGLSSPDEHVTADRSRELWDRAVRDAKPYREVHRSLEIEERRILEDPVMQDSRYSQLIQAADLIAYGAYHRHKQDHPEIWGTNSKVVSAAIIAYMKTTAHWLPESDHGVIWLDV